VRAFRQFAIEIITTPRLALYPSPLAVPSANHRKVFFAVADGVWGKGIRATLALSLGNVPLLIPERSREIGGPYWQWWYRIIFSLAPLVFPDHPLGPFKSAFLVVEGFFEGNSVHCLEPCGEPREAHLFVDLVQ